MANIHVSSTGISFNGTSFIGLTGSNLSTYVPSGEINSYIGNVKSLSVTQNGINVYSVSGSTGMFNYLTVVNEFVSNTLSVQGLSGGTGSFKTLNVTGMNVGSGVFNTINVTGLNASSVSGTTGMFNSLSVQGLSGGTGSFKTLNVTGMNVGSGVFNTINVTGLNASSVSGTTGMFNYLVVANQIITSTSIQGLSGGTGSFTALNVTDMNVGSITGYTGTFTTLNVTGLNAYSVSGSTGSFNSLIVNSTGISLGQNAGRTGSVNIGYKAGQHGQGTGSIAIGYLAGPTGMTSNSIALNASENPLYATGPTGGFFVSPIASYSGSVGPFNMLVYGADNQIVTVPGTSISLSTPTVTSDSWLINNFIGAPPGVTASVDSYTTTDIYIIFTYPSQINSGFGLVPTISNFNYTSNIVSATGLTGTNFISTTVNPSTSQVVQCLNISTTKSLGYSTYKSIYNSYIIPITKFSGSQTFNLWYGNQNPNNNLSSVTISLLTSGQPTAPFISSINSSNYNNISLVFSGSSKIDINDPMSSAALEYNISYKAVTGSNNYRYNDGSQATYKSGVSYNFNNITDTTTSTPYTSNDSNNFIVSTTGHNYSGTSTSNIYPDTKYLITVNALNSNNLSLYTGVTGSITTSSISPLLTVDNGVNTSSLTSGTLINGISLKTGSSVSTILKSFTNPPSFNMTIPIHNTTTVRGFTGPGSLVTLYSSCTGPTGISGPSTNLHGFTGTYGTYPLITKTNNIGIVQQNAPTDQYISSDVGYQGYYLQQTINVTGPGQNGNIQYPGGYQPYILSVTGVYASNNSNVAVNYNTKFYYDGETGPNGIASIYNTPNISIKSAVTGSVCGLTVINSATLNISVTGVTGIGQYFYNNNPGILQYTTSIGVLSPSYETDLSNLTTGTGTSGFNSNISFINPNISLSGVTSYINQPMTVSVTPYNLAGLTGTNSTSNSLNVLFDPISIAAMSSTIQQILLLNTVYTGCRIWSATTSIGNELSTPNTMLSYLTNNSTSFSVMNPLYDNKNILSSGNYQYELLYTNGQYTTDTTYNKSYTSYLYNSTINYGNLSSLNSCRYSTFAWKLFYSSILSSKNIYFTLNGVNGSGLTVNSNGSLLINNIPILLYYRLEDTTETSTLNNFNSNPLISSPWINGNLYNPSTQGSGGAGYTTSTTNYTGLSSTNGITGVSSTLLNGSVTFKVICNYTVLGGNNTYLYCRIGLPFSSPVNNNSFSFTSISCTLNN